MNGGPSRRAWRIFQASLAAAFVAFLLFMGLALAARLVKGELPAEDADRLLRLLYWGTYPLVFIALGALTVHFVQYYRGSTVR
ncbi:MAG: hypothetical protein ACPGQL_10850 [Thermoplasmatota archaeon]